MRLAQAARNLAITTDEIVSFFHKREIEIVKDSNTKLTPDAVELLFAHYKVAPKTDKSDIVTTEREPEVNAAIVIATQPEEAAKRDQELANEEEVPSDAGNIEANQPEQEAPEAVLTQNADSSAQEIAVAHTATEEDTITPTNESIENNETKVATLESQNESIKAAPQYRTVSDLLADEMTDEDIDNSEQVIIKAPKVTLQGLNVLGKIDLPEPKLKKEFEETKPEGSAKIADRKQRKSYTNKGKNELTPQQIRARDQRKAAQKLKREEASKKKKRTSHYKENVLKPKQQQQSKKKTQKKIKKRMEPEPIQTRTAPKTVLGKFWNWLNT